MVLCTMDIFNPMDPGRAVIATDYIDNKSYPPQKVIADFCPFCGERYPRVEENTSEWVYQPHAKLIIGYFVVNQNSIGEMWIGKNIEDDFWTKVTVIYSKEDSKPDDYKYEKIEHKEIMTVIMQCVRDINKTHNVITLQQYYPKLKGPGEEFLVTYNKAQIDACRVIEKPAENSSKTEGE